MAIPAGTLTAAVGLYRPPVFDYLRDVTVELDDWTAGAVDSQGTEWWLTSLEGWHGTADVRLFGTDRAQDHGQFDAPSYFGSRVVTVQGTAIAPDKPTAFAARDIISSLCWDPAQLYTLRVSEPGMPTRRCSVRLNTATKVSDVADCAFDWQVQVKAPDPRRYDDIELTLPLQPPTGVSGGIQFPLTFPIVISMAGMSTSQGTATNVGTIAVKPVVEFRGPMVDPQIAHLGQAKSLALQITLTSDDLLVADFDRRTLLLNGSASRSSALTASSAWWQLDPGGNDVMLTAGGGSGTATVRWRSGWH